MIAEGRLTGAIEHTVRHFLSCTCSVFFLDALFSSFFEEKPLTFHVSGRPQDIHLFCLLALHYSGFLTRSIHPGKTLSHTFLLSFLWLGRW